MAPMDAQAAECHHQLPFSLPYAVGTTRRQDGCAQLFRHHPEFGHRPATWRRHRLQQRFSELPIELAQQTHTHTHTQGKMLSWVLSAFSTSKGETSKAAARSKDARNGVNYTGKTTSSFNEYSTTSGAAARAREAAQKEYKSSPLDTVSHNVVTSPGSPGPLGDQVPPSDGLGPMGVKGSLGIPAGM